jgi:hypothetical protein
VNRKLKKYKISYTDNNESPPFMRWSFLAKTKEEADFKIHRAKLEGGTRFKVKIRE